VWGGKGRGGREEGKEGKSICKFLYEPLEPMNLAVSTAWWSLLSGVLATEDKKLTHRTLFT